MAVSKRRRRKNGKKVGNGENKMSRTFAEMESGVSLQDLINTVAYQDYVKEGKIVPGRQIDFEDPDTQAVVQAVHEANIEPGVNWGPVQAMIDAENSKKEQD